MQNLVELDTRGMQCPMPLLRTKLALRELSESGAIEDRVLKVISTDAGSARDIPRYINKSPYRLLKIDEQDGVFYFWIGKEMAAC